MFRVLGIHNFAIKYNPSKIDSYIWKNSVFVKKLLWMARYHKCNMIPKYKYIKERGLTASDVTVRPWPPVNIFWWKVWSHSATQTNYTSICSELIYHHKFIIIFLVWALNLKKTMKMTWHLLFGLVLFSAHVYGRSQLAATTSYVPLPNKICTATMHM